jgi:Transposase
MEESTEEPVWLVERVCAIDIGKAGLVVCMRLPHATKPGRRVQEVREYATTTPALLDLADWLHRRQIELVAMEATSDYWKPVFYLLEAEGFQCWLLNAKHVKNVPGRPRPTSWTRCGWPRSSNGHVPAQPGPPQADPAAARCHPLPAQPGPRTVPGEATFGEDLIANRDGPFYLVVLCLDYRDRVIKRIGHVEFRAVRSDRHRLRRSTHRDRSDHSICRGVDHRYAIAVSGVQPATVWTHDDPARAGGHREVSSSPLNRDGRHYGGVPGTGKLEATDVTVVKRIGALDPDRAYVHITGQLWLSNHVTADRGYRSASR